ncbi:hypothetical protein QOT17_013421 [Balamuthia mandrillaris]
MRNEEESDSREIKLMQGPGGTAAASPGPSAPSLKQERAAPHVDEQVAKAMGEVEQLLQLNRSLMLRVEEHHQKREPQGLQENVRLIQAININLNEITQKYEQLNHSLRP